MPSVYVPHKKFLILRELAEATGLGTYEVGRLLMKAGLMALRNAVGQNGYDPVKYLAKKLNNVDKEAVKRVLDEWWWAWE